MPDEFLKTWQPTFIIRHPARAFPSLYRMMRRKGFNRANNEPHAVELTTQWQRSLYNFYEAHYTDSSTWPIVLDADDVMQQPKLLVKYAGIVGLDPEKLRFTWDKMPQEEFEKLPPMSQGANGSLMSSEKVDLSKVAGVIDLDAEAAQWREEFGEEAGLKLGRMVRECLGDYEYMHSKRLQLD